MNIFIIQKSLAKQYMALQKKVRYSKKLIEYMKAGFVVFCFFCFGAIYIYYVNQASTMGYFYKQEQQRLESAQFDFNIQSFETTKVYEQLRNSVLTGNVYLGSDSNAFSLSKTLLQVTIGSGSSSGQNTH